MLNIQYPWRIEAARRAARKAARKTAKSEGGSNEWLQGTLAGSENRSPKKTKRG